MLNGQKHNPDKPSLGFDKFGTSTSHASNSDRKTLFVKHVKVEDVKANVAFLKEKNSCLNDCVKSKSKASSRKQISTKFVHTCHHCRIVGHIKPNCLELKSQRPWNKKDAPKKENGVVESCVSKPKSRFVPIPRKQSSQKFVLTCHHCGKVGYI